MSLKVAVYASGGGSNFESLLQKKEEGLLDVEFSYLLTNNSQCGAVARAKARGIEVHHISSKTHPSEKDFAQVQLELAKSVDVIVLAGYMKKIPKELLEGFSGHILNIHPALLPSFGGQGFYGMNVHKAVVESGVKFSGITIHLVEGEYDRGPILEQSVVKVDSCDTASDVAQKVLKLEHDLYWQVLKAFSQDRVIFNDSGCAWITPEA